MENKLFGFLSLIALIPTLLWALLIIWGVAHGDVLGTLDQALAHVRNRDGLYLLTYANAMLFTLSATMLFSALCAYYHPTVPGWSAVGLVHSTFNLFVYTSQIIIVPQLVKLQSLPGAEVVVDVLLGQMIQAWPGSAMGILNGLAYAVLGIPSIIFGSLLCTSSGLMRAAGVLLVLNAIACFAGPLGLVAGISMLDLGRVVGGSLFLLALIPLSVAFLQMDTEPAGGKAVLS